MHGYPLTRIATRPSGRRGMAAVALVLLAVIMLAAAQPARAASTATYRVSIYTPQHSYGGTDARVYLTLHGTNVAGQSIASTERQLDTPSDNFEQGHWDSFQITTYEFARLTYIRLRHDNTGSDPGWFVDRIEIANEQTHEAWHFPVNRWLARDECDGAIDLVLFPGVLPGCHRYKVTVVTGTVDGAGTDADVFIRLYGRTPTGVTTWTREHQLDNAADNFERGRTDVFYVTEQELRSMIALRLRHDNSESSPAWFVNRLEVQSERTGVTWTFPVYRWLGKGHCGDTLEVTLYPNVPPFCGD